MTIKIITDSACDLPQNLLDEYGIHVLPFLVFIEGEEFVAGETIKEAQVYQAIREGQVPKTAQVPTKIIVEAFKEYAAAGQECIYIAFSSKLSGTCNTARAVAAELKRNYPDFKITVCDTLSGSLGQGLIVLEAAQLALAGASSQEIVARVNLRAKNNVEHIFSVDDLNYLYRGGRVGYANAFLGGILNIKPILHVKDGLMIPIQKVRGKNAALKRIVSLLKERSLGNLEQIIAISHADDLAAAEKLQEMIKTTLGYSNFLINAVGSVLSCHIGLGGVAAFFVNSRADIPNLPQEV